MGRIFLVLITLLVIIVIGMINIKNNKRLVKVIVNMIKEINNTYISILKEKSILIRITQSGMIIGSGIFALISIVVGTIKYINIFEEYNLLVLIKAILIVLISVIIIYFIIGYTLLISSKIQGFINNVEDKTLKIDLILSYLIISTYFTVLVIFPEQFKNTSRIGLVGVTISYFLNLKVLFKLISNPHNIKSEAENITSFSRIMVASVLLVMMIIINLFLAACFINSSTTEAFTNNPSIFDLFYYTIITFTTVGYGDISPVTTDAKVLSMIISITSVICITVFLSTILSYRDKFINKE